jgi:serpin B
MLSRRQTLQALGAAGLAAPLLSSCGETDACTDCRGTANVSLVKADVARSMGDPAAVAGVVAATASFAADLWGRVGSTDGNLALSPFSVAVALAMTANGAAGATARQMLEVLHVDSLARHNAGMAALTRELESLAGPVTLPDGSRDTIALTSADQLFGDRGTTWQRAFLTVLAKQYGAGMRGVDFRGDAEGARVLVNRWTSSQTHGRIPQILPKGIVDATTRLVLVNALYFKAPWDTPFQKTSTSPSPFSRADGSTVTVPMMRGDADESAVYLAGRHFTGARLPYRGRKLAMTVALPTRHEDAALAELLGPQGLTSPGQPAVAVTMPRWTYRVSTDLGHALDALGMSNAFSPPLADFSRMTSDEQLFIEFVVHQTFVAVDEDGTEAAAATAVGMADSAVLQSHTLVLDRPFLYVIHDTAHGTPLFVGRVADPS